MRIAICPSAHGFGHTTRQLALGKALLRRGFQVHFFSHIPHFVSSYLPDAGVSEAFLDVGLAQPDPVSIDVPKTKELLLERFSDAKINRLGDVLNTFDLVIADVPPSVLEACQRSNTPCVAVTNFDWSWTYRHFPELSQWQQTIARWQQPHLALHIAPGPPLSDFSQVIPVAPLARPYESFSFPQKRILLAFGGFESQKLIESLPQIDGFRYLLTPPNRPCDREDIDFCDNIPYQKLISGCWAILGKPGYGLITEAAQSGTPLFLIPRTIFPESSYLRPFSLQHGHIWLDYAPHDPEFKTTLAQAIQRTSSTPRNPPTTFSGASAIINVLISRNFLPST